MGERVGVSLAGFCLPFFPRWLVNNLHLSPPRRPAMRILSDGAHLTATHNSTRYTPHKRY